MPKRKHSLEVRLLMHRLRPKAKLKVIGEEKLLRENEPFVMVCNHGMWHMPVAAILNLKVSFRPWIHDVMLKKETCKHELEKILEKIPEISERMKNRIASFGGKLVSRILNDFDPIPVVRGCSREVIKTLQISIEALKNGDNLLIFPEMPRCSCADIDQEAKMAEQLRELYTGFAQLGKLYFRQSGKSLRFFPIYINREKETLQIGEAVCFDAGNDAMAEKHRISGELYRRLKLMAEN